MNETILKALFLLLTAPVWVPVVRALVREVWAVSEPPRAPGTPDAPGASGRGRAAGGSMENRPLDRLVNTRWETGRSPAPRRSGWSARDQGLYRSRRGLR